MKVENDQFVKINAQRRKTTQINPIKKLNTRFVLISLC